MNLLQFITKEANKNTPILSAEQSQAVLARFAVRGNAYKNGINSANRQFPGVEAEVLAAAELAKKAEAADTIGNAATGGDFGRYTNAAIHVGDAATAGAARVTVSTETNNPTPVDPAGPDALAEAARGKIEAIHNTDGASKEDYALTA